MKQFFSSILKIIQPVLKNRIFTIKTGLAQGLKRRFGLGFLPQLFLSKEEEFLQTLGLTSKVVYDIGAYIGLTTMFFARAVGDQGQVIAFEPNPENYQEAILNLQLNTFSNVRLLPMGIGQREGRAEFVIDPIYPTRGTLATVQKERILKQQGSRTIPVDVVSLDKIIKSENLPIPDLIKIDVEGFESEVLKGMAETVEQELPDLYIEIHEAGAAECVAWLLKKDYQIRCVETDMNVNETNASDLHQGHLYCTPQK